MHAPAPAAQRAPLSKSTSASTAAGALSFPKGAQPLHVVQLEDALLKIQTVRALTGLSDATIYRKTATGDMPAPIRLGARCTRWRAGDITAWLRAQTANA